MCKSLGKQESRNVKIQEGKRRSKAGMQGSKSEEECRDAREEGMQECRNARMRGCKNEVTVLYTRVQCCKMVHFI